MRYRNGGTGCLEDASKVDAWIRAVLWLDFAARDWAIDDRNTFLAWIVGSCTLAVSEEFAHEFGTCGS